MKNCEMQNFILISVFNYFSNLSIIQLFSY